MTREWWVGGYGVDLGGTATGIGRARERDDGTLEYTGAVAEVASPSWLLEHRGHVYATAEALGEVHSFRIDGTRLVPDGVVSSGGELPCHLSATDTGLIVSNYADGVVGVIELDVDSAVGELVQVLHGEGSGPRHTQPGPHAHASLRVDDGTVLALDLGADRIHIHRLVAGRLERRTSVETPAGTGPRDIARHPSGLIHVLGELSGDLLVFEWTGGRLEAVASSPVPGHVDGDHGAGLAFGPDGRFVYSGLRGSHRIAVIGVENGGRMLEPIGWVASEGDWPRHLVVDGELLHVANQVSNELATFRLGLDGMPAPIAAPATAPSPAFLLPVR